MSNYITGSKRRALRLNASKYCLMEGGLGWGNLDSLILGCVDPCEVEKLMNDMHNGLCGGHFAAKATTKNLESWLLLAHDIF